MKNKRQIFRTVILCVLLFAVVFTVYANFTKEKRDIKKGSDAPDFILQTLDGKEVRLSELKGKGVFLNFWGTWCKPCEKEMPYMENQYSKYKEKNVEILAVNIGESDLSVSTFVERHGLSFPILMDRKSVIVDLYNIGPIPTTILIDAEGKIVDSITGTMTEQDIINHLTAISPSS